MSQPQQPRRPAGQQQRQVPQTQAITVADRAKTIAVAIEKRHQAFGAVAAKHFDVTRMIKMAQASLSRTPHLAECTQASVLVTLMRCAELGLEPGAASGGMHLVPFKNRRTGQYECTGIPDYRGQIDLARRTGEVGAVFAEVVYKKDYFRRTLGTEPRLEHEPSEDDERGDIRGFYAVAMLTNSKVPQFTYMTMAEVSAIKARSKASDNGPWQTDFIEMGKKTVLRRLYKLLPLSPVARRVMDAEDALDRGESPVMDPDELGKLGFDLPELGDVLGGSGEQGEGGAPAGTAGEVERALAGAGAEQKQGEPPVKDEPGADG